MDFLNVEIAAQKKQILMVLPRMLPSVMRARRERASAGRDCFETIAAHKICFDTRLSVVLVAKQVLHYED